MGLEVSVSWLVILVTVLCMAVWYGAEKTLRTQKQLWLSSLTNEQ